MNPVRFASKLSKSELSLSLITLTTSMHFYKSIVLVLENANVLLLSETGKCVLIVSETEQCVL